MKPGKSGKHPDRPGSPVGVDMEKGQDTESPFSAGQSHGPPLTVEIFEIGQFSRFVAAAQSHKRENS